MKIAKLNIEGYIGSSDIVSMFSGEKTFNLSQLKDFLNTLESDVTDIHAYINSGGGSVNEGWAIYDKLKASGYNVTTIGEGIVGSIATVIYMAGAVRKLHENSKFFIHNPYCQLDGSPMEGADLIALGEDLKAEQTKILNFYAKQTGKDASLIEPLMSKATDLTTSQAIELGFATDVIGEAIACRKYELMAYTNIKPKQKSQDMSKVDETILNKMNKFFKNFSRVTKGKFFDMDITATNADGATVNLVIESDTEDLTGKSVFIVDAEGNQTPAPDGDYVDADGKVIKVTSGKVTEVVAKTVDTNEPTIEDLKAELEALKAEKETLTASVQAKTTEVETIKAEVEVIKPEFEALKKVIIGEGAEFDKGTQTFKAAKKEPEGSPIANEMAQRIMNRHNK